MSLIGLQSGLGFLMTVLATAPLQVEAESTEETTTLTLYDVTRTKEAESSGVSRSWSRALQPAGTESDGSKTTFSEEVVEYEMTVSAGSTSTFSTTTWEAIRIQSESGYVRIQTGSSFSSVQSCSYASNRGGCMDIIYNFSRSSGQTATATATITSAKSSTLPASEATITPIQTLLAVHTVEASTPSPTPPLTDAPPSESNSDILKPALLGSLLGGAGLILSVLGIFFFCRRRQRRTKGPDGSLSRGLVNVGGGIDNVDQHQYHYRSPRIASSMIESSKDGASIDSSYFPKSHYTKSPPHSPTHSFSTPILPFKSQVPLSPLSSIPYSEEPLPEVDSTKDTMTSQSTVVPPTSTPSTRQNTADTTVSSHPSTHPSHGFRIHPSRFIERLSLSSTYLESLLAGGNPATVYQEPTEIEPEPPHSHQDDDRHEPRRGQSSSSLSEAVPPTNHDSSHSPPLSPSFRSLRNSPIFATPGQTPIPGMYSPSSSSIPPASQSAPHLPYAHSHIPTTPTFLPPSTPRSWVTPSPFSHQSFQTAEEGGDDSDASTVEDMRTHPTVRSHSPSRSRSPSPSSTGHGGTRQYGYAV